MELELKEQYYCSEELTLEFGLKREEWVGKQIQVIGDIYREQWKVVRTN